MVKRLASAASMPLRALFFATWTDPSQLTALVIALTGLVTAVGTLAKVFHNTGRIATVEQGVERLANGTGAEGSPEPEPRALGKG